MSATKEAINRLNKYNERLEALNKQMSELNKTSKEYQKLSKERARVEEKAEKASKDLSNSTSKLSSNFKQHRKLIDEASNAQGRYNKNTNEGSKSTNNFGKRLKTAIGTLFRYNLAYRLINAAQTIFTELTAGSIRESIKFEKQLANLGAVAGASAKDVARFGENALEIAGKTKFTAQEIVGLQTELSKLGFTADDVISSTEAIAFAAQALGSPLEATASLVGKVRNQFGLLVEQTTLIADTLVSTINASALSFDSFATAMQYVGPIAADLGLTLQQTAGAMGVLADSGFTASRIGTGLRGILTEIGKTSADAERSLRKLAEQNISLGEAVELVGKRNAAQLLTLLKNIDAIDEANDKYYQHGRALISAAKQADTFSGQMDILVSNFREFQISLGNVIVDSDIFLKVLGFLSDKAQQTALGFKILRQIGIEGFNNDVKSIIDDGIEPMEVVLDRLVKTGKISSERLHDVKRAFEDAAKESKRLGVELRPTQERLEELGISEEQFNSLKAYFDLITDGVAEQKKQAAITKGQENANQVFGKSVDSLIEKSINGINVNDELKTTYENIEYALENLRASRENASGEYKIQLSEEIRLLEGYLNQITNSYKSEEEILKQRTKAEQDAAKANIDSIKNSTQEQIDAINERAKQETAIAETAEQRADIEAERQKIVSDLYAQQAEDIAALLPIYVTQEELINKNVKASEKLSEVLGSEVINDLNNAFKDYSTELTDLQDALENGKISQEDYERSVFELRERLKTTISTFKEMFGTTPELDIFFNNLLLRFDALSVKLDDTDSKTKKTKDTLENFFKDFKDGEYLEYVQQAFDALGASLDEFNNTAAENTKNSLESQLDSIKNRYEVESEILKSQLDNQLITESQFRQKQNELRKAQLAEENSINRQIFEAEKKQDVNDARIQGLEAAAKAVINILEDNAGKPLKAALLSALSTSIIAAQTTAQISAINQRKFFEKKFADGGIVNGPSHADGGVPFTVKGRGGYEMEGGEFIVNKEATAKNYDLLKKINDSTTRTPTIGKMRFADGGLVTNNPIAESVDYLKAIAEATTSTAISASRPVRAFVADKDLRSNATERRIRDRNDRL